METRVYKDVSQQERAIGKGLTFKQWLFIGTLFLVFTLNLVNAFVMHLPGFVISSVSAVLLFIVGVITLFRIRRIPVTRWLKLWFRYNLRPQIRTYSTQKVEKYEKKKK